ncbi:hypothetical protein Hanom_Chr13g01215981 [Helianthus anomalus]
MTYTLYILIFQIFFFQKRLKNTTHADIQQKFSQLIKKLLSSLNSTATDGTTLHLIYKWYLQYAPTSFPKLYIN